MSDLNAVPELARCIPHAALPRKFSLHNGVSQRYNGTARITVFSFTCKKARYFTAVLQIHDILVWIQTRGSIPLTNGYGSSIFVINLQDANKNYL